MGYEGDTRSLDYGSFGFMSGSGFKGCEFSCFSSAAANVATKPSEDRTYPGCPARLLPYGAITTGCDIHHSVEVPDR